MICQQSSSNALFDRSHHPFRPLDHTVSALCPSDLINGRRIASTPNKAHHKMMSTHRTLNKLCFQIDQFMKGVRDRGI